jgi:hypothetical protein
VGSSPAARILIPPSLLWILDCFPGQSGGCALQQLTRLHASSLARRAGLDLYSDNRRESLATRDAACEDLLPPSLASIVCGQAGATRFMRASGKESARAVVRPRLKQASAVSDLCRERRGVLAGGVSRSKKPAGCPRASASRSWADGFAACKRVAAEEDTPARPQTEMRRKRPG